MASDYDFLVYFRLLYVVIRFFGNNNYYLPYKKSEKRLYIRKFDLLITFIQVVVYGIFSFYCYHLLRHTPLNKGIFGEYFLIGVVLFPLIQLLFNNLTQWLNLDNFWFVLSGFCDFDATVSVSCCIFLKLWNIQDFGFWLSRFEHWVHKLVIIIRKTWWLGYAP